MLLSIQHLPGYIQRAAGFLIVLIKKKKQDVITEGIGDKYL